MAAMSNFLESALLNHTFRGVVYTAPTTIYVALYTTATDATGAGTEVVGGSYARQTPIFNAPVLTTGNIASNGSVTFTNMPACTVTNVAILDALTAGNMLVQGTLLASKVVAAGENFSFAAGDLNVTFS